jgi:hypothetical protein
MIIANVQETKIAIVITKIKYIKITVHQITKRSPKHSSKINSLHIQKNLDLSLIFFRKLR